MFTGIIQGTGVIRRSRVLGLDLTLTVDMGDPGQNRVEPGDSVAVDGVCLTVTGVDGGELCFDVSRETLSRTLLGARVVGDAVNLELALLPADRLGGHFVTGHVDGIGCLEMVERVGSSSKMRFSAPAGLSRFIAEKGSICIDGVSLTVNAVTDDSFEVNIVPHTLQVTTAGDFASGRRVHLEIDIIARYLDRLMSSSYDVPPSSTEPSPAEVPLPGREANPDEITQEFLSTRGFSAPILDE
jgi:riboflavin synthase